MIITTMVVRATLMPAVRAALGLAPTARSSKPNVDRFSSQATTPATRTARMIPPSTRRSPPSSSGSLAELSTSLLIASVRTGFCTPFWMMIQPRKSSAM